MSSTRETTCMPSLTRSPTCILRAPVCLLPGAVMMVCPRSMRALCNWASAARRSASRSCLSAFCSSSLRSCTRTSARASRWLCWAVRRLISAESASRVETALHLKSFCTRAFSRLARSRRAAAFSAATRAYRMQASCKPISRSRRSRLAALLSLTARA